MVVLLAISNKSLCKYEFEKWRKIKNMTNILF